MYVPPPANHMWDTWLLRDGEDYQLFFMQATPELGWRTIGRAQSRDLIHWLELPAIVTQGSEGAWDECENLTGTTVKHDGRYYMFYGSATQGQKIGLMTSDDLRHWERCPDNPILVGAPPYTGWAWRDLCAIFDSDESLWHGYVCAQYGDQEPALPTIVDKTLVAWVRPARPEQKGGGVLTLSYGPYHGEVFDGIVLGSRESGKWMAGSNTWFGPGGRTQPDQSANPVEIASPGVLIRIAIVYRGGEITILRDDAVYTRYAIEHPAAFGDGSAVMLGIDSLLSHVLDRDNPRHRSCARCGHSERNRQYLPFRRWQQTGGFRRNRRIRQPVRRVRGIPHAHVQTGLSIPSTRALYGCNHRRLP